MLGMSSMGCISRWDYLRGVLLQRIQIVKNWIDAGGTARYQIFEVAGDAGRGSVEPASCKPDGAGSKSLCAVWQDPDFDSRLRAFYYARVLETPSCRWSTWECIAIDPAQRPPGCSDPRAQQFLQERRCVLPLPAAVRRFDHRRRTVRGESWRIARNYARC